MAELAFLVQQHYQIPANGTHTFNHTVARNERLKIHEIFIISDGTYNIVDISDDSGQKYSNCNASVPILSTFIQDPAVLLDVFKRFEPSIEIRPGGGFNIGVTDTSGGANDVYVLLSCTRVLPE